MLQMWVQDGPTQSWWAERLGARVGQRVDVRESWGGEQRTGTLGGHRREGDDRVAGDQGLRHHVSALRQ